MVTTYDYDPLPWGLGYLPPLHVTPTTVSLILLVLSFVIVVLRRRAGAPLKENDKVLAINDEMNTLRKESNLYNTTDTFAKYAKIQRRIAVLEKELKAQRAIQPPTESVFHKRYTQALDLFPLSIGVLFWGVPLVRVSTSAVWPIASFLAWPGCNAGTVSGMMWVVVCTGVFKGSFSILDDITARHVARSGASKRN